MRDIRFRAWDEGNGEFLSFFNVDIEGEVFLLGETENVSGLIDYYPKNIILMQYTGLDDKNGKPIFEGDILRFIPDNIFGEVKVFNKSLCFGVEWVNSRTDFFTQLFYMECEAELEVIGNIYENSELLDKQTKEFNKE